MHQEPQRTTDGSSKVETGSRKEQTNLALRLRAARETGPHGIRVVTEPLHELASEATSPPVIVAIAMDEYTGQALAAEVIAATPAATLAFGLRAWRKHSQPRQVACDNSDPCHAVDPWRLGPEQGVTHG